MSYPTGATRRKTIRASGQRGFQQAEFLMQGERGRPRNFLRPTAPPPLAPHRQHPGSSPWRRVPPPRRLPGPPSPPGFPGRRPPVPAVGLPLPARKLFRVPRMPWFDIIPAIVPIPGIFPGEEINIPSGWQLTGRCPQNPPVNWVNKNYGRLNAPSASPGSSAANVANRCLNNQAMTSIGQQMVLPENELNGYTFGWQINSLPRYRIAYAFWRPPGQPHKGGPVTWAVPWPPAIPFVPVPAPMVQPHPDGRPDRGYAAPVEAPPLQDWPSPVPARVPVYRPGRSPYRPRPMPWFPMPMSPSAPGSAPGDTVVDGIEVGVGPDPDGKGDTVTAQPLPWPYKMPRQRIDGATIQGEKVKERKQIANPKAGSLLGRALNGYTEGLDALDAIWKALPPKYRTPPREVKPGVWVSPRPHQKAADIWNNADKVDVGKAIGNLVRQQATDALIGGINQGISKNAAPWYNSQGRPVGWTFGPAL